MIDLIAALFCAATIWTDLVFRKVPNAVLMAALVAISLVILFGHAPEPGPLSRLLGFALGFLVMLPAYALGRMGAGDVKFFAVTGLLTGPLGLVTVWIVGSLLAFIHAVAVRMHATAAWGVWRDYVADRLRRSVGVTGLDSGLGSARYSAQERGIPYAAYLAIGVVVWMILGK
ncbi:MULTISPECIES: A24 family peptidase [Cupriavidus]